MSLFMLLDDELANQHNYSKFSMQHRKLGLQPRTLTRTDSPHTGRAVGVSLRHRAHLAGMVRKRSSTSLLVVDDDIRNCYTVLRGKVNSFAVRRSSWLEERAALPGHTRDGAVISGRLGASCVVERQALGETALPGRVRAGVVFNGETLVDAALPGRLGFGAVLGAVGADHA